jgi:hypothetical protein
MEKLNRLELYKEIYIFEFSRREKIHTDVSIVFAITSFLAGFMTYLLKLINEIWPPWQIITILLFLFLFFPLSITYFFLIRAIFKYNYGYLPYINEMENYYKKLEKYYKDEKKADDVYIEFLINEYAKYAKINSDSTELKVFYLIKAKEGLLVSSIIAFLIAIFIFAYHAIIN